MSNSGVQQAFTCFYLVCLNDCINSNMKEIQDHPHSRFIYNSRTLQFAASLTHSLHDRRINIPLFPLSSS